MAGEIHLIEKMGHVKCVDKAAAVWESGWWAVSSDTAARLIGGRIFLHKTQQEPSFFGGRIMDFRIETSGIWTGRIIFSFTPLPECKDATTGSDGWSMEKKIVYDSGRE